jgi:DNA polymerase-3 subunit delta
VFAADASFDWGSLLQAGASMSLFAEKRLLELRLPSGKPGDKGAAAFIEYCSRPAEDTIVLISLPKLDGSAQKTKWGKALVEGQHTQFVQIWPVDANQLPSWIRQRLSQAGLSASQDAVELIAARVEGNLLAAAQEIDKLGLLTKHEEAAAKTLDAEAMDALVADSARFDVFRLVDAALNGNPPQVSRMLAGLRAEGEAVPALMGMVVKELQTVATLARARNFAAECKALRIWDSKQAVYKRALGKHPPERWQRFLAEAGRVDRIAKGRVRIGEESADAWLQLERLLLAMSDKGAARLLAS